MKIVWLIAFLILFGTSEAQVLSLPSDPEKFLEEYSRQIEKHTGAAVNPSFSDLYQNVLDLPGKKEAIALIQLASVKGLRPAEVARLTHVLSLYRNTREPSAQEMENFLSLLRKSFEPHPSKAIHEALLQMDQFFTSGTLYTSAFNRIRITSLKTQLTFFDRKQDYFSGDPAKQKETPVSDDIGWDEPAADILPAQKETPRENLPDVQGLFFVFDKADLTLLSPSDSITITGTQGAYNFMDAVFVGEGGEIRWTVAGKPVNAVAGRYAFRSASGRLLAENVNLMHEGVLQQPVTGVLEIKLEKRAPNEASTYPRFKSYRNNAAYTLSLEDSDLSGGYTVVGQKITTASLYDRYSRLHVNKSSQTSRFEVVGHSLTLTDTLITSEQVSFVARLGKDSVSHPAIQLEYRIPQQHVQLNKVRKGGFRNSMFSDTFHQVDIRCDAMSWDLSSGKMDFYIVAGKQEVAAEFESFDYFNMSRLSSLSNAAGFNPLMAAATLIGRKKKNSFTVEEMMQFTRKERHFAANGLLIGTQTGFFDYHPFEDYYSISRKGLHYYFVATGKKDYDDLVFSSLNRNGENRQNATIDFNSKSLNITGAQNFKLSDSLGIQLLPDDQSMEVIGNKVFRFKGKIVVKNFTFFGEFVLEYEKFLVNLNRIDSITFIPLDIYKKGGKLQLAGNFQFGKSGKLYLNSPDNKSGRKNLPEYPKLEIPEGLTVYFNEKGRYHSFSDQVYFKATGLSLDSLNTRDPVIPGIFTTAGIFKPVKDALVLLPDSSMGMAHRAATPYPVYGSSTAFKATSEIVLNKRGISSSGELHHLAAVLKTEQISFLEDRSEASGNSGGIAEKQMGGAYFPQVNISAYTMHWEPAKDSMAVYSEKGFEFYNGSSYLKGSIVMRTAGLFGNGELSRTDSDIASASFKFDKTGFLAEKADIKVKADEADRLAFSGRNVDIDFNVQQEQVRISSVNNDFNTAEAAFLEFPSSSYKTTIDKALWSIKDKIITMDGQLENSVFTSTASHQYGLRFNGTGARYDIKSKNLSITGVEEIRSADAAIQPAGGNVFVKNDGKLDAFTDATIVADTLNHYHTLTRAGVTVNSRLSYSGNADYRYVNISSDTFNIKLGGFEFAEVTPDGRILDSKGSGKLSTIARASISEKDQVYLAKKMLYVGEMTMLAPFKNLSLRGQVLPDLKKYPMIGGSWINYAGSKSEDVTISIDETLKDGGKPLYVGLHMKYGANNDGIYPSFLSVKSSADDYDIFLARGTFGRDEPHQRFYVKPQNESDNTAEFYDDQGLMVLSGRFNLLGVPGKIFETVGKATVNLDSMKYRLETMMLFDFPLPIPTVQKMGQNIVKTNLDAGNSNAAIEPDDEDFTQKLSRIIGTADTEKYKANSQKGHIPLFKESARFLKSLVLSRADLQWNATANAYYSTGPIGISNIGDVDINALVNGYVEIVQSHSTGNELHIYLDLAPEKWYYFIYRNGQLGMVSSDEEVNRLVNTGGGKDKGVNFVDINEAARFKKRFLISYHGMTEEEYNQQLKSPPKAVKKTKKEEGEGF